MRAKVFQIPWSQFIIGTVTDVDAVFAVRFDRHKSSPGGSAFAYGERRIQFFFFVKLFEHLAKDIIANFSHKKSVPQRALCRNSLVRSFSARNIRKTFQ